eukprot:CAMPEP_0206508292 /NCGR_PEP_ID=MMETSP0324_2-20121206/58222_1 /ASSEMBLY_ACC=CAM_ASM_000836 /TAXON_ID=2866 /ORGANISM="Crypthecodinium cohnii, Strain Seligo" /LENGTH=50 /DNA_ID=CAMNT_0053999081 /DNA_START=187 /DNA_END=336 /DNA_ORIENTATION=-
MSTSLLLASKARLAESSGKPMLAICAMPSSVIETLPTEAPPSEATSDMAG